MPQRAEAILRDLTVDDYFEGTAGTIWKVIREAIRGEDRFLGIKERGGELKIVNLSKHGDRKVVQLIYGATRTEAVANIESALGGKVLAEQREQVWIHPDHVVLASDKSLLRAHLLRFHLQQMEEGAELDYMLHVHTERHKGEADHTHENGVNG